MYLVINITAYFQQNRSEMRGMSLSLIFSNITKSDGFMPRRSGFREEESKDHSFPEAWLPPWGMQNLRVKSEESKQ